MLVQTLPDTMTKLAQMGDATVYEPAGDQPQSERNCARYQSHSLDECVTEAAPYISLNGHSPATQMSLF